MISVETARKIIQEHTKALPPQRIALKNALGFVLAENISSPINTPPFDQSAMDGYAFSFADWKEGQELNLAGIVAAGDSGENKLPVGSTCRIFTGAPVPPGADTVVMQEKVSVTEKGILILDSVIQQSANVRPQGSETKKGEVAMLASTRLTPAALGYLANLGITEVSVFPAPKVSVIITGKELTQPGNPLTAGKIYDSNSLSLAALLQQNNISDAKIFWVDDEKEATKTIIQQALAQSDLIILTGGISVGDYDYVNEALTECGVEELFHKIKQKPGKPLYFGEKGNLPVFALPGNPAAVLTCFYEYVLPCLKLLQGEKQSVLSLQLPLLKSYNKKKGLTHFLKGRVEGKGVMPLSGQESYKLNSFSIANCIIELEEEKEIFEEGELVSVQLV
jgi:molybdopterin molybdotransferase